MIKIREVKNQQNLISPEKAIEIAENIFEIQIQLETTGEIFKKTLILTDEQRYLAQLFHFGC